MVVGHQRQPSPAEHTRGAARIRGIRRRNQASRGPVLAASPLLHTMGAEGPSGVCPGFYSLLGGDRSVFTDGLRQVDASGHLVYSGKPVFEPNPTHYKVLLGRV